MIFARIYKSTTGLIAVPASEAGDKTASNRGLTETVFCGRPAPMVLVLAMLTQFGGELLAEDGELLRAFGLGAGLPATI